jgi:hypothetical protein
MPLDETLEQDTASDEQPVENQAEEEAVTDEHEEPAPEGESEESDSTETVENPAPSRLFANKYKSPEELERAYLESQAEASRMAAELAKSRGTAKSETKEQKYTSDQLENWKEGYLREVSRNDAIAERLRMEGKFEDAQQYEAKAATAARQIRLIDRELRQLDIQNTLQTSSARDAESRLMSEAEKVVRQYVDQLTPGTPLYTKAYDLLQGYGAMGLDISSPIVQAQSVALAVQILGLPAKKIAQTTRKELTTKISQALKQGVVAGAGKGVASKKAPDFDNMPDAEFQAFKRSRGLA